MFFVIWRGWGIVVIGIAILALVAGTIFATMFNITGRASGYPIGFALILGGVATWYLGKRMNRNAVRELIDPATGEHVSVRNSHDFFFVPVQLWGPVMGALGAALIALELTAGG
jgi:hypothetical protein